MITEAMKLKHILATFCLGAATVAGAQSDAQRLAAKIALANPELSAYESQNSAEVSQARAENVLEGPDVDFDYKFNATNNGENRWSVGVSQSFEWPGSYAARRKANNLRSRAYDELYAAEFTNKKLEALKAIISLAAANERVATLERIEESLAAMVKKYDFAFKHENITILERKKLDISSFIIATEITGARTVQAAAAANLRALAGGHTIEAPADALISEPLYPFTEYSKQLENSDKTIAAHRTLFDAAHADISSAKNAALPSFKLGYMHDYEDGQHFNGVTIGIALPQWAPEHRVKAARMRAKALEFDALSYSLDREAELSADYAAAKELSATIAAAGSIFSSNEYSHLLDNALNQGAITVLDYLRELNEYLNARLQYIDMQAALATAMASLNRYNTLP